MTSPRGKNILAAGADLAISEQIGVALEERGYSLKKASSLNETVQNLLRYFEDRLALGQLRQPSQLQPLAQPWPVIPSLGICPYRIP